MCKKGMSYLERFDELVKLSKKIADEKGKIIKKHIKEKNEFNILGKVVDDMLKKEKDC